MGCRIIAFICGGKEDCDDFGEELVFDDNGNYYNIKTDRWILKGMKNG